MPDFAYSAVIHSPLGNLGLKINSEKLSQIDFLPDSQALLKPQDSFAKETVKQIERYFSNPRFIFNIPLYLEGTPLQITIWELLKTIPRGTTMTYGAIANTLQTNPRVVGNACRHNPIPIIIPCHRVVAAQTLGGYSGATDGNPLQIKQWLLQHEGVNW